MTLEVREYGRLRRSGSNGDGRKGDWWSQFLIWLVSGGSCGHQCTRGGSPLRQGDQPRVQSSRGRRQYSGNNQLFGLVETQRVSE